jgi:hypothetical protein
MEEENRFFICLNAFYKDGGRGAVGFGEKGPWQLNPYMFRCVKSKGCIIHTRQNRNLLKIKKRPPSLPQLGHKRRHEGNNCIGSKHWLVVVVCRVGWLPFFPVSASSLLLLSNKSYAYGLALV